jgi:hypothetical protein
MASSIVKFTGREVMKILADAAADHLGFSGGPFEVRMKTEWNPILGIVSIEIEPIAQEDGE